MSLYGSGKVCVTTELENSSTEPGLVTQVMTTMDIYFVASLFLVRQECWVWGGGTSILIISTNTNKTRAQIL